MSAQALHAMAGSLRWRLFAVALAIVGAALAAVLALGGERLLAFERARLDLRMCLEARRLPDQARLPSDLPRLHADIALKLHLGNAGSLKLRVQPEAAPAFESDGPALAWPSAAAAWQPLAATPATPEAAAPSRRTLQACSVADADDGWRVVRYTAARAEGRVAVDIGALRAELRTALLGVVAWVAPAALLLSAGAAWLLSTLMMRPLDRLRDAMASVSRPVPDQRLSPAGEPREFQDLIAAYNTMLERLEASFRQASRFSADAAHELRTPLTILRGRLEQAINQSDHRAIQADLTDMLDEVGSLAAITRKLLLLSQADAGRLALHREPIDLSAQLEALVADAQMVADDRRFELQIEPGLRVRADALLLRQLLNNLISNAVRHGRRGGWIELAARRAADGVRLEIANDTQPLPPEVRERLFDRFYRAEAARAEGGEGHGLGLSLAREIARAHGGELRLMPSRPDELRLGLFWPDG